jgi:hypothetical protein
MMILIDPSDLGITNLKLILCFENMSDIKINFDKSKVVVTGSPKRRNERLRICSINFI